MGTTVRYAGIALENVQTLEFSQTPVRDDSNTDQRATRFFVDVETFANIGTLNDDFAGLKESAGSASHVVDLLTALRSRLTADRQPFYYEVDGKVMLKSDTTFDLDNGPKVKNLSLIHITGTTIRIRFSVEMMILDCFEDYGPNPVVNNRWSSTDDIGEDFAITRTWRGKLRISTGHFNVRNFRHLCVPVLQLGYRLVHMNFVEDPSGLEVAYEIVHQQMVGDAPPSPCSRWSFVHAESFTSNGMKNTADISIMLYGTPRADKWDMIAFGCRLLKIKSNYSPGSTMIPSLMFIEQGGDSQHSIEVRAQISRTPSIGNSSSSGAALSIGAASLTNFGRRIGTFSIPNYNQDKPIQFGPYGTADKGTLAGLFACYLQNPCDPGHGMSQVNLAASKQKNDKKSGSGAPASVTASVGDTSLLGIKSPGEDPQHKVFMYQHCRLETRLELDGGMVACPIAKAKNSTSEDTVAFIQIGPQTCIRVIRYEAERLGEEPLLWKPKAFTDAQGIKHRLKTWRLIRQAVAQTGDGQKLFTVDAEYVFYMSRPPKDGEKIAGVVMPWDDLKPSGSAYPGNTMKDPDDSKKGFA